MNRIPADLFRHNRWANQQLLDACAGLREAQLNAGDPGAYGTIAETLTHAVAGEELYVWLLGGKVSEPALHTFTGFPGFDVLKERAVHTGQALTEIAAREEPGRTVRDLRDDPPSEYPAEMVLIQAINHGAEHRTNVTTILARLGVTPPEIDGWAFLSELANHPPAASTTSSGWRASMNQILGDLFRHNRWANERLLDACAGLSREQLQAGNPGAYGSIADTLHHLVVAEGRYAALLTGEQPNYEREEFPGFDALKERANRSGTALIEVAEREEPGRVLRGVRRGETYELPAEMLLIQAINHATEHRTNVTTILAQIGVQPPDLDGWSYLPELTKR